MIVKIDKNSHKKKEIDNKHAKVKKKTLKLQSQVHRMEKKAKDLKLYHSLHSRLY